ncbi:hypothetical protein F5882DRAFT_381610 [Hyaloscypha sp. PMI_1271]|nr:hypothetical protein F5882DRAFT_381610 [Hyaloscypha sp. PMI_1271]
MTKYDPEEEKRIAQASGFYARNPHVKKSTITRQFRVKYRLWKARLAGRKPQNTKGAYNKTLNPDQEEAVKQFIDFLIYLGHKADLKTIRAAANKILAESASTHQVTRV